jgi:homoserine kinase
VSAVSSRVPNIQIGARARAFAPAGVGNVAVGFDLIGMALDCVDSQGEALGDIVTATVVEGGQVSVSSISGLPLNLPLDAEHNTAARGVRALLHALDLDCGMELHIHKGIPLGSGLGGSAASAVAGVVAANEALGSPFEIAALYPFALEGECASSGAKHGDNVGPQLIGGLAFTNAKQCIALPIIPGLHAVVVHPDFVLETKIARAALTQPYPISDFVHQSDYLASFLIALYTQDKTLLAHALKDVLVEPKRAPLIPGFANVKAAAIALGAIGASISGAGPSVFAWFADQASAENAAVAMQAAFAEVELGSDVYIAPVYGRGARIMDRSVFQQT